MWCCLMAEAYRHVNLQDMNNMLLLMRLDYVLSAAYGDFIDEFVKMPEGV